MCLFTLTLNCEIDMNLMYGRVNENVRKALHPYVYDHPNNQNPSLCVFVKDHVIRIHLGNIPMILEDQGRC